MAQHEEVSAISSTNTTNLEFATPEKQRARTFLRERFLRVVTGIVGKKFHLIFAYTFCYLVIILEKFVLFPPLSLTYQRTVQNFNVYLHDHVFMNIFSDTLILIRNRTKIAQVTLVVAFKTIFTY